jgi:hypothetical protein
MMATSCPFCGVGADLPHETQQACISALHAEIARMRRVVDRLNAPINGDFSGNSPNSRDSGQHGAGRSAGPD